MTLSTTRFKRALPQRQHGIITAMAAIILVAAVVYVLSQSLGIIGTTSSSNDAQSDSIAAFFLAESGLERANGLLNSATPFTDTKCTDIAKGPDSVAGSPFSIGINRTFSLAAISCDNSPTPVCGSTCGSGTCGSCKVTVTGTVNNSSRIISQIFTLQQNTGGAFCNTANPLTPNCTNAATLPPTSSPPTWKSSVTNTSGHPAIAFFNLGANRQGNWSSATCSPAACQVLWTIDAQNGTNSVSNMGNAIPVAVNESVDLYQILNLNRNVVENGALFPGSTPTRIGAYWDDTNPGGGGTKTVGKSGDLFGMTNNGTKNTINTSCPSVSSNSQQTCNNWCLEADTLVLGIAANATALSDRFTSVIFNTAGSNPQNIPLGLVGARFPSPTATGAPPDVFTEIRYAHNPNYLSGTDVYSGAKFSGYIGVVFNGWILSGSKVLTVTAPPQGGALSVGSVIVGMDSGTSITSLGTCPATPIPADYPCTYNVNTGSGSGKQSNDYGGSSTPVPMQVANNVLTVTSNPSGQAIALNDKIFVGGVLKGTVSSGPSGTVPTMTYNLAAPATAAPSTIQTDGLILSSTSSSDFPYGDAMSSSLRLAIKSGTTGQLCSPSTTPSCPAGTTVVLPVSPATLAFNGAQLSNRPSIPLFNAQLCGGTCAFFDQTAATTQFTVAKTGGADYWAAGFMCLSGVTQTPTETTSGPQTATPITWYEVVR